ncbi:MAG TPA: HAMP domain-containing sensor histidine kinase [Pedobacter sp.]
MKSEKKSSWVERLVGKLGEQTMEARIFNVICLLSIVMLAISVLINYLLNLKTLALLMAACCLIVLVFYYYTRYKNKFSINVVIFGILSSLAFSLNYYYNAGIDGPTLSIFILLLILVIAVSPTSQHTFWISLNIITVCLLLLAQYSNPGLVEYSYSNRPSRYFDMFVTYVCVVLSISSITKYIRRSYHKEKLEAEEKATELEASNITKNKLLSIFAHDLRAPLNLIQSYLGLLSAGSLTEDEKKLIEKNLLENTQYTEQMLSNILSWTRAQMEGVYATSTNINLLACLNDTIKIQEIIAKGKGISLENQMSDSIEAMADTDMLQLVVRNILSNAIKFTPKGGQIVISSKLLNGRAIISISDNGIGISEDEQTDLFSLKGKSTYGTNKEKGVGLGLVLCKEFIDLQNGTIWFNSNKLDGTTFYISLKSLSS